MEISIETSFEDQVEMNYYFQTSNGQLKKSFTTYLSTAFLMLLLFCSCDVNDDINKTNDAIERNNIRQNEIDTKFEKLRQLKKEKTDSSKIINIDSLGW